MTARNLLTFVISAGVIASAALAGAQRPGGPPGRGGPGGPGGRMRQAMETEYKKLHVTPSQHKKLDAFQMHERNSMQAFMKAHKGDRSAFRPQMQKMRAERMAFLKRTLTGKQFKQFEADMKAMRAKMGGGRPGGPGMRRG